MCTDRCDAACHAAIFRAACWGVRARALSVTFHRALAGTLVVLPAVCRLGQFMGSPLIHHAIRHHLMRGDAVRQMVDESTHLGR